MGNWKNWMMVAVLLAFGAVRSMADMDEKGSMKAPEMPAGFDKVKALVGTWKGTSEMDGKPMDITNTFELTSGGSVILERLFVGTPKEMVSIYHANGGKLCMTHYCSLGNQPQMTLKKSSDNEMDFMMTGKSGLKSSKEMHMHGMNIVWKDPDHVTEQWTLYNDGKAQTPVMFELARQKEK